MEATKEEHDPHTGEILLNEDGTPVKAIHLDDKLKGYGLTVIYSIIVIVFGALYKKLALVQTYRENHRY